MFDKMKQLMELKKQAAQIKKDLEAAQIEVEKVPGIKITISGAQDFRSIQVDENKLDPSKKVQFETELLQALNAAISESQKIAAERMRGNIPGFPGI